jgi:four helix bundle protein
MNTKDFAFKDLLVWQKAMVFADYAILLAEKLNSPDKHFRLVEQFESAATSVPMNIAEGKGRKSKKRIYSRSIYFQRIIV